MDTIKNYTITKETEKAVYVSIPYWIPTNKSKRNHETKKHECWVPKSLVVNNEIPAWVILKSIEDIEKRNPYKHITGKSATQEYRRRHLGQTAPKKTKIAEVIIDEEKLNILKDELVKKYNVKSFRDLVHNPPEGITQDYEDLISLYWKPHIENLSIPNKTIYHYL